MRDASMPNVLIWDLPDKVQRGPHPPRRARGPIAAAVPRGDLARLTTTPTLDDALDHLDRQRGGRVGFAEAADTLARVRAKR